MKIFNDPDFVLTNSSVVKSFVEFVKIDTQSNEESKTSPSTEKQLNLQNILKKKLINLGCENVVLDDKGYLYALFPGNINSKTSVGLLAHVDTATDFSGENVKPIFHKNYDGGDLDLSDHITIHVDDNPALKDRKGETIITASGDTLLGADDKAGIAEILAALEILQNDKSIKRPDIKIAFTPDEEIGRGAGNFDVKGFNALCAYTLDGSLSGEVNFETFSADKGVVTFTGVAVHPGFAKGKMVNALTYLGKFLDRLPSKESPEETENREGFYHPTDVKGNAAKASATLILRDFDNDKLADRGKRLKELVADIAKTEPRLGFEVAITKQYRNMADTLKEHPEVKNNLMQATKDAGLYPVVVPIRGGTDGSGLTAKGLPTPNIFTGGMNFHGPREWISTTVMGQAVCVILNLVQRFVEKE